MRAAANSPVAAAGRFLAYPLQGEILAAGLVFYLLALFLYGTGWLFFHGGVDRFILWVLFTSCLLLTLGVLLIGYCHELIDCLSRGIARPPRLPAAMVLANQSSHRSQVLNLALALVLFYFFGHDLARRDFGFAALLVWILMLLAVPAMFAVNLHAGHVVNLLNPLRLIGTAIDCGRHYLLALLLFGLLIAQVLLALQGSPLTVILLMLLGFYTLVLFCQALGLGLHRLHRQHMAQLDLQAEHTARQAAGLGVANLGVALEAVYERLRGGRESDALQRLDAILDAHRWQNSEQVFDYVAAWPYAAPGLHLAPRLLAALLQQRQPMKALAVADWCLQQQPQFVLEDTTTLDALAAQATTTAQLRTALALLTNHLQAPAADAEREHLLSVALAIAAHRLHDEQQVQHLQALRSR